MQICTGTVACAYNFLTVFSLSSLYLTLSSLSVSQTHNSFFLSSDQSFFLSSIFLPLTSVDRHRRRSPSLPIALSSFVSRCFRVEWAWSVGFELNGVECLSPSPPLAFGGVNLISRSHHRHWRRQSCCSRQGVDSGVGLYPFCWVCFSGFLPVGCVDSDVIPVWIVGVGRWLCG